MARLHGDAEPPWPPHLVEYRREDGWESKLDWEIARVHWARSQGFKHYKMLPLLQRMAQLPNPGETWKTPPSLMEGSRVWELGCASGRSKSWRPSWWRCEGSGPVVQKVDPFAKAIHDLCVAAGVKCDQGARCAAHTSTKRSRNLTLSEAQLMCRQQLPTAFQGRPRKPTDADRTASS